WLRRGDDEGGNVVMMKVAVTRWRGDEDDVERVMVVSERGVDVVEMDVRDEVMVTAVGGRNPAEIWPKKKGRRRK
ncbi:hypothetical protein Tco_0284290, partial [Tanacetum coccineum]